MDKFVHRKSTEKRENKKEAEEEVKIPVQPAKKSKKPEEKKPEAPIDAPSSGGSSYENWLDQLDESWRQSLASFVSSNRLRTIHEWVSREYSQSTCRPISSEIFTAFKLTPFNSVKVVVVGQDPYPGPIEAMGLSFSVHRGVPVPGSLKNIYKCLQQDKKLSFTPPKHGDLSAWARQGVFMLNAVLTVRQGAPNSHAKRGWEGFTDEVIKVINRDKSGVVFMLWGAYAQEKAKAVDKKKHLVLEACHPSPLAASKGGFFSCGHFSKANEYLRANGQSEINWSLD
jgi:uracil-DNA glycosylase